MQAGLSNNELSVNPASKPATDERWEAFLTANPRGQFQQSWRWAEVKAAVGWQGGIGSPGRRGAEVVVHPARCRLHPFTAWFLRTFMLSQWDRLRGNAFAEADKVLKYPIVG